MNLGVMAIKGYSRLPWSSELKPHYLEERVLTTPERIKSSKLLQSNRKIKISFLISLGTVGRPFV